MKFYMLIKTTEIYKVMPANTCNIHAKVSDPAGSGLKKLCSGSLISKDSDPDPNEVWIPGSTFPLRDFN